MAARRPAFGLEKEKTRRFGGCKAAGRVSRTVNCGYRITVVLGFQSRFEYAGDVGRKLKRDFGYHGAGGFTGGRVFTVQSAW